MYFKGKEAGFAIFKKDARDFHKALTLKDNKNFFTSSVVSAISQQRDKKLLKIMSQKRWWNDYFVAGVHGVRKTYLGVPAAKVWVFGMQTASQLIKRGAAILG